ncbi:hypothetical protein MUN81_02060 [Hymenobacter sp. 5317J-9]|uniref:hypothetical protein n=1 Tax=Hymenobacter sp. 5317J-9 TaxID=2932250 RepID=UPI001FD67BFF|nr:hypothetical protein [Hymenobacter sp. 5317J-9]UOQ98287.1 hypothetical protein MUN81_02060 [Hymenobacter sp. 5317J-9]
MRISTLIAPALLLGAVLTGCSEDQPTPTNTAVESAIKVTVSEAGAPPYELKEARLIDASYQTGAPRLSLSGKLSGGKTLTLYFSKGTATTAYTTNALTSSLEGAPGANESGTTTYDTKTRIASGQFRTTFTGVGEIVGSFPEIQL